MSEQSEVCLLYLSQMSVTKWREITTRIIRWYQYNMVCKKHSRIAILHGSIELVMGMAGNPKIMHCGIFYLTASWWDLRVKKCQHLSCKIRKFRVEVNQPVNYPFIYLTVLNQHVQTTKLGILIQFCLHGIRFSSLNNRVCRKIYETRGEMKEKNCLMETSKTNSTIYLDVNGLDTHLLRHITEYIL